MVIGDWGNPITSHQSPVTNHPFFSVFCGAMKIHHLARLTGHNAAIFALSQGRSERHFLSAAGDGWIAEWDLDAPETGKLLAKVNAQIFSLFLLKNSPLLLAGDMNGGVHWIDLEQPERTKDVAHHRKGTFDLLDLGEHVFTCGGDGMLTRWSVAECRSLESFQLANQALRCLDFSEKRNEIAVGASDGAIYLLDAASLELKQRIAGAHGNSVFSIRYHPNGELLLSGGRDAHLNAYLLENEVIKISSQPAHWFTVNSISFHPAGHFFATGSRDKTIKIWDAKLESDEGFHLLKVLEGARDDGHFNSVNKVFWSGYRGILVSCSDDRTIILWQIEMP